MGTKKSTIGIIALAFAVALMLSCGDPPLVLQGEVVSYDESAKTLSVKDERASGEVAVLSLANAEIGAAPASGDLVRVAYREREGAKMASRVMNITRQTELQGRSKGH